MKWHPFTEVVSDITSKFNKIKASAYKAVGQYKIIDQGKEAIAGYTDDENLVNAELSPVILFGDHTRVIKYEDSPIALGADGAKALKVNSRLANTLYVYHFLRSVKLKEAGYSRHFKFLKKIKIPIPQRNGEPNLDDQIRIAHLLSKVEVLSAQRKQYLQQLDGLLKSVFLEMFGDPVRNEKGWDRPELRNFGRISTGNTPPRKDSSNYSAKHIEWVKTDNIPADSVYVTQAAEYLSDLGAEKARTVTNGALLVACIAGSVESIGRAALANRTVAFNQQINTIQPNGDVNPFYLYALFKISKAFVQSHATKGMKKILTKGNFEKIRMIKPPIELQSHFASIVEKIEGIKTRYQESLVDLEQLYGAVSQKAFKGELDLSRVMLKPTTGNLEIKGYAPSLLVGTIREQRKTIDLPDVENMAEALATIEGRQRILHHWLDTYLTQLKGSAFSVNHFLMAAQARTSELCPEIDVEFGITEYDQLKDWIFTALGNGTLSQVYDDPANRVQLVASKS